MTVQHFGGEILVGGVHRMPLSKGVRAGDWIFVSGQTAMDEYGVILSGGIEAQTRAILSSIRDLLAGVNCSMSDIVKTTVWIEDPRDFWSFNRAYAEFFPENPPARSTLRSQLMLDAKIEIEALAYKPL